MLTIYGLDFSPWVNRVRFTANQIGLEYKYVPVDLLAGEGQSDDYKRIHPAGKVPAMVDDDFSLFESDAICRYLAHKTGSPLYPSELRARALVDQWTDFTVAHVVKAMDKICFNRVFYRLLGAEQDPRSLDEGLAFAERFMPLVDAQLSRNTCLAGDELSLADMILLAWLDPVELAEFDLSPYTHISNWRDQLKQQDFYTACHADYKTLFEALTAAG